MPCDGQASPGSDGQGVGSGHSPLDLEPGGGEHGEEDFAEGAGQPPSGGQWKQDETGQERDRGAGVPHDRANSESDQGQGCHVEGTARYDPDHRRVGQGHERVGGWCESALLQ
jgi:hypothetical protein